MLITIKT